MNHPGKSSTPFLLLVATTATVWPLAAGNLSLATQDAPAAATDSNPADQAATPESDEAEGDRSATEPKQPEPRETQTLLAHDQHLQFTVPAEWKVVEPRNRLIELELAILPRREEASADEAEEDAEADGPRGRLTMMAAGGDVDANLRRWIGQFRLGRDAEGKDAMRRDRRQLRGAVAHVLDIAGTYFDSPQGPLGPKVERPDYRMLGAIIEVEGAGKYFVKFYGPAEIVDANQEAFEQMLSSMKVVASPSSDPTESSAEDSSPGTTS